MTLTFQPVYSGTATFLGPGYAWTAKSVLSGVPGHQYQFVVRLHVLPTTLLVCELINTNYQLNTNWDGNFGCQKTVDEIVTVAAGSGVFGSDAEVILELDDVTSDTIADGPQTFGTFQLDPVGQQYICTLVNLGAGGSGSFTDADRTLLSEIYDSTSVQTLSVSQTHTGLSGSGSIATLSSTRRLRVTVTQFPANAQTDPGVPEYYFNLGFITLNDTFSFAKSARLVFEHQTYVVSASCVGFGYTLRPGTVINVEELQPLS